MFAQSYLQTAVQTIREYNGGEPLASFLKKFFSAYKKYGSRDRRQITHLCYCYFRIGKALLHLNVDERVLLGLYLCNQERHSVLDFARPQWNDTITKSKEDKVQILKQELAFQVSDIFPFKEQLSQEVDHELFAFSFLEQPHTFLRIRPGNEAIVRRKLSKGDVPFTDISTSCIAVSPSTKLEEYLLINKEVVIQDVNSQKVLSPIVEYLKDTNKRIDAWDCCAASGGKSILLKDVFLNSQLTVSDIRESILINLRKRFKEAGIFHFNWFVADVANSQFRHKKQYDLVICDVPCSGAGTWGRTPEQLYFFTDDKINYYSSLQKQIAGKAWQYVKKGGMFLYITCSVFKEENEALTEFIQENSSLQLESIHYFTGYQQRADTLFTALFICK